MIKSNCIKSGFKVSILIFVIFLLNLSDDSLLYNEIHSYAINESFGMIAMVEKEKEEKPVEVVKVVKEDKKQESKNNKSTKVTNKATSKVASSSISSRSGVLTGYAANCKGCGGTLACKSSYKVKNNGVVTYPDSKFGNVRIVASSKKLACGSIVKFNLSGNSITAIVLDRGVLGNNLDLLMATEKDAINKVGRRNITYQVLRNGW